MPTQPAARLLSRRQFLAAYGRSSAAVAGLALAGCATPFGGRTTNPAAGKPFFQTRGIVLIPDDFSLTGWPKRAREAGLTTIGLHHGASPQVVVKFIRSEQGRAFLKECHRLGLAVEYELHAMRELLPRELFARNPELFRMNERGERTPDSNLCTHSHEALDFAAVNAVALAKILRPTTSRYFYWGDDAMPWCRCPKCRGYSDTDQAVILENHLLSALRKSDGCAQLAHLAYSNTLWPPRQVRPAPGIFLEYAPINRRYDIPYAEQTGPEAKDGLEALDANLAVFDRASAQVLEYWLDVSRFSKWKKPAVKLPWNEQVFAADLDTYGKRGIRHVTSFAVFLDADYVVRYGEPLELIPYGRRLQQWKRE